MNFALSIPLSISTEQAQRLVALQQAFVQVCNALAPMVQQTRVWNRVALHHLAYRQLRERFPAMGSQMVCNAIYSVSRTSRMVFQHPSSPFHLSRLGDKPLPLIRFSDSCPVYFDRHTLSLKGNELSMYTLDGRIHFQLALTSEQQKHFHTLKLREVVLVRKGSADFELTFTLADEQANGVPGEQGAKPVDFAPEKYSVQGSIPEYVFVEEAI